MVTDFTFSVGDKVRIDGRIPGLVQCHRIVGLIDVWTNCGLRTVSPDRIGPAKKTDTVDRTPPEARAPARRRGQR